MEDKALSSKAAKEEMKAFGMYPADDKYQEKCRKAAALLGEDVLEVANKDLETAKFWYTRDTLTGEEIFEAGPSSLKTFVVKLNSGSLLIKSP